ncbi:hypothetical protein SAMN05421812_105172 [Asanoa hainanensis]|uniref:Uncharacterized protein n=1 Tax=Asanoa hainanensis TaxID=560556 RepID=A0A239M854_9ACTN|nr:hypothetical protein [Asanoa hainanensis]SNT38224.1 hypothetical protein SAMN05421812_105172 [Asanoa hainanensis]
MAAPSTAARAPRVWPPVRPDARTTWRQVRQAARWEHAAEHVSGPARTGRDGIAELLSKERYGADRILAALDLARADVSGSGPLTFARLEAWQREVLAVLAREDVVLDRAAPLLMTRWPAADPHDAEALAKLVAVLIKQTRR